MKLMKIVIMNDIKNNEICLLNKKSEFINAYRHEK